MGANQEHLLKRISRLKRILRKLRLSHKRRLYRYVFNLIKELEGKLLLVILLSLSSGCSVPTTKQAKEEPPSFYHEFDWISKEVDGCKPIDFDFNGDPAEWECPSPKKKQP